MTKTLYIFCGLSGSGKSTLAAAFAQQHQFSYYNTDLIRKELAGIPATQHQQEKINQGLYCAAFTEQTYEALCQRALQDLQSQTSGVVIDGSYQRRQTRKRLCQTINDAGYPFSFIFCHCDPMVTQQRLKQRAQDPNRVSDANWTIYQAQLKKLELLNELPTHQFITLDTSQQQPSQLLAYLKQQFRL